MDHSASSSSVNCGALSLANELKQMDAIIQRRTYNVIAMKRRRNTRVPISCIPNEIMAEIFLWVKEMVEEVWVFQKPNSTLAWIRVSHVCSIWREIAVNLAELWTTIPLWNAPWTDEMMKRARQAPLKIKYKFGENHYSLPLLKQALGHPDVGEISIDSIRTEQADLIPTGLIQLERLTLSGMADSTTRLLLPAAIMSKAKRLVELDLSHCTMDWISYLPSSVTVLKLYNVRTPSPLPFSRLIEVLEGLQSLEVLVLAKIMESFDVGDSSPRRVKLHRIRELATTTSIDKALLFFRYITFSPDIQLAIETTRMSTRSPAIFINSIRTLLTCIGNVYTNWTSETSFGMLMIHKDSEPDSGSLLFVLMSPPGYLPPSLLFKIDIDPEETATGDIIPAMLDSGFPVRNVTQLFIGGFEHESSDISFKGFRLFLAQTLNRLPRLSRIRVDDEAFALGLDMLTYEAAGSSEWLCFPNLSTLDIVGVDFGPDGHSKLFSLLKDCLLFRCENKAEINKLVLAECLNMSADRMASLREIVADVILTENLEM